MLIRDEAGASHDSELLILWRIMPAASPLRGHGRALRPATPSGWLVVANRAEGAGACLVCLASCAHRRDARQILDALLLARRRGAASFDVGVLHYSYTRPCPAVSPPRAPLDFPTMRLKYLQVPLEQERFAEFAEACSAVVEVAES